MRRDVPFPFQAVQLDGDGSLDSRESVNYWVLAVIPPKLKRYQKQ